MERTAGFRGLGLSRVVYLVSSCGEAIRSAGRWRRRDAREHVMEPGKRLDAAPLAGSNEASQYRPRLAAGVAAKECPVAAAQRDIAVGPFGRAVVSLQLVVFEKA